MVPGWLTFEPASEAQARLARRLPRDRQARPAWAANVFRAASFQDDAFTLWVAERAPQNFMASRLQLELLYAFRFFSLRQDLFGGFLIERTWRSDLGWARADQYGRAWLGDLLRLACGPPFQAMSQILEPDMWRGARFTPLLTRGALETEGRVMQNCLGWQGPEILRRGGLVFRVDGGRRHPHDFSLSPTPTGYTLDAISRAAGRPPVRATLDLVADWIIERLPAYSPGVPQPEIDQGFWRRLWAPYRSAIGFRSLIPTELDLLALQPLVQASQR